MTETDKAESWTAFRKAVNMPPATIEKWLDTDDSKRVGWKGADGDGAGESVGHNRASRWPLLVEADLPAFATEIASQRSSHTASLAELAQPLDNQWL